MSRAKKEFRLTGFHVLMMLIVFFGIIFAVNFQLVYYANTSWTGLLPGNGYEASIKYDAEAKKARAMLAKGWKAILGDTSGHKLYITLTTKDGKPVTGLKTEATIGHPAGDRDDHALKMRETAPGHYQTEAPVKPGSWRVDVKFLQGGKLVWRVNDSFVIGQK